MKQLSRVYKSIVLTVCCVLGYFIIVSCNLTEIMDKNKGSNNSSDEGLTQEQLLSRDFLSPDSFGNRQLGILTETMEVSPVEDVSTLEQNFDNLNVNPFWNTDVTTLQCPTFKKFDSAIHEFPTYYNVPSSKYPTIESAVDAADPGGVILLDNDVTFTENVVVNDKFIQIGAKDFQGNPPIWKPSNSTLPTLKIMCGGHVIVDKVKFENGSIGVQVTDEPETTITSTDEIKNFNLIINSTFFNVEHAVQSVGYMVIKNNDIYAIHTAIEAHKFKGLITENTFGSGEGFAIGIYGSLSGEITKNYIENGYGGGGIYVKGGTAQILDNILDMKGIGFGISVVSDTSIPGVTLAIIKNNDVTNARFAGISGFGSGATDKIKVLNNKVNGTVNPDNSVYDFWNLHPALFDKGTETILADGILLGNTAFLLEGNESINNKRSGLFVKQACGNVFGSVLTQNVYGVVVQDSLSCGSAKLFTCDYSSKAVEEDLSPSYPISEYFLKNYCYDPDNAPLSNWIFNNSIANLSGSKELSVPPVPAIVGL